MGTILCADIGTTSLKAALIDGQGEVVSFYSHLFTKNTFISRQWIEAFKLACNSFRPYINTIEGISISGNGPTIVSDSGRTILWNSTLKSRLQDNPEDVSMFLPQLKAFKTFYPEDYKDTSFLYGCPEYLIHYLTGTSITILPEERFQIAYWDELKCKAWGIDYQKLPPFVPTGYNALISDSVREELGLPKVPVFCGGPDFVTALIGTGTITPGRLCDRSGSSEGLNLCINKPVFKKGLRTLPSVIPGLWNVSVIINKSGSLIDKFRKDINNLQSYDNSYEQIIDYSLNDKNSEGYRIISSLSDKVSSGICSLQAFCNENNLPMEDSMTVTGGQAKNPKWLTFKARKANINIKSLQCKDAELMGNAIIGRVGLGQFKNYEEACNHMIHTDSIYSCENIRVPLLKFYKTPSHLKTIIFDIDSTLYTSDAYAFEQVDCQIRAFAKKNHISPSKARNQISEFRRKWSLEHHNKKISLGNTLTYFGVSIQESVEMRRNLLEPKKFLSKDIRLIETLDQLSKKYKLICVTNNPVLPARKTLKAIGIEDYMVDVIGLDTCGKSKPAREPFLLAMKLTDSTPEECLAVGDRYDMDVALPLEMGMGALLIGGVEDVYNLINL